MSAKIMEQSYRVYFNKYCPSGLIWSVDQGDQSTEINVKKIVIRGGRCYTASGPGDNKNSPTVWIVVEGVNLQVSENVAYLI